MGGGLSRDATKPAPGEHAANHSGLEPICIPRCLKIPSYGGQKNIYCSTLVAVLGAAESSRNLSLGTRCKGCESRFITFLDPWNSSGGWKFFPVILDFCLPCCWDCNTLSVIKTICDFGSWHPAHSARNECARDW